MKDELTPPSLPTVLYDGPRHPAGMNDVDQLLPIMRGVYLRPHGYSKVWQQKHEITLARGLGARHCIQSARALTHESAAELHGLWVYDQEPPISVLMPTEGHANRVTMQRFKYLEDAAPVACQEGKQIRLRKRKLTVPEDDLCVVNGQKVTTLLRTALDCACDLPARKSLVTVDAALRAIVRPGNILDDEAEFRWRQAQEQLQRMLKLHRGRRGIRRAREVLRIASPLSGSTGESVVRWLIAAMSLPLPELQYPIEARGNQYYLDFCWPEYRKAIEFDGYAKYGLGETLQSEKRRQDSIHALGIDFMRLTWEDILDAHGAADRIVDFLPAQVAGQASINQQLWSW